MEYKKLSIKAIKAWRIGRLIGFIITIIILSGGLIACFFLVDTNILIIYSLAASILLLYDIAALIVMPNISYKRWQYLIEEDKVEIRKGIYFLTTIVIPICRIQHISLSRGPIYRSLGLCKLKIFLASGAFEIEGLDEETANVISENLKNKLYVRLGEKEE